MKQAVKENGTICNSHSLLLNGLIELKRSNEEINEKLDALILLISSETSAN